MSERWRHIAEICTLTLAPKSPQGNRRDLIATIDAFVRFVMTLVRLHVIAFDDETETITIKMIAAICENNRLVYNLTPPPPICTLSNVDFQCGYRITVAYCYEFLVLYRNDGTSFPSPSTAFNISLSPLFQL
jgi:hypothetical protein